ncbi:hypothetical protein HK105_206458 [Polyrhizophydium stewartii]|uniref:Cation/H+ exchanger domain-containing protein n=1 Tax=Polyrhizophydium stewartii TaxID=2732419 RepID=A0ABR4N3D9_9FUNG
MAIDAEMALGLGLLPAIVAGAAVFLVRLQRLPHSVYAWCLRGALALVVPTSIVDTAWELVAELRRPLPTSLSNLIGAIEAVLFVMAEIEFLKLLAPFAPDIRTGIVINFQIALLISAIPYALSAFHSMFDGGLAKTLKTYVSSWPIAAGIFDVGQQVILLLFVLWRLQGATHAFRMRYAAIIASCAAVLLCGLLLSIYVGDNLPNGRQLLREHCIHIFVLLGAMAMES